MTTKQSNESTNCVSCGDPYWLDVHNAKWYHDCSQKTVGFGHVLIDPAAGPERAVAVAGNNAYSMERTKPIMERVFKEVQFIEMQQENERLTKRVQDLESHIEYLKRICRTLTDALGVACGDGG